MGRARDFNFSEENSLIPHHRKLKDFNPMKTENHLKPFSLRS